MRINTNIMSFNAHRVMSINSNARAATMSRLSSGYGINRAADNAANLAISEKMRAQIRGLNQASRNVQDGISLIQTADGALGVTQDKLKRIRDLLVQASNDTNSVEERNAMQLEIDQLVDEIDSCANTTMFNNMKLLDGSFAPASIASPFSTGFSGGMASFSMKSTPFAGIAAFSAPPAVNAAFSVSGDTVTITSDGIFDISAYSNHTIKVAASNVMLTQTTATTVNEVYIDCNAGTNLFLNGININATQNKNIVNFIGAGNTLNLIGTNTITSDHDLWYGDKALIHAGSGTDLTINEASSGGELIVHVVNTTTSPFPSRAMDNAAIGGNTNESGGNITIESGKVLVDLSFDGFITGAGIGGGYGSDSGNIIISGGEVTVRISGQESGGAGIGGGGWGGSGENIIISGGKVTIDIDRRSGGQNGAGIGGGNGALNDGTVTIDGGSLVADTVSAPIQNSAGDTVYKTQIQGAGIGANTDVSYTIDGIGYTAKTGANGKLNLYLPQSADGKLLELTAGGKSYEGTLSVAANDNNSLTLARVGGASASGNGFWLQVGANTGEGIFVNIDSVNASSLGIDSINASTHENAGLGIIATDIAINTVSAIRGELGAVQNRLEFTIANIDNAAENLSASESRIRDSDMAKEYMRFVRVQTIEKSATAMLAQANALPEMILQLLRN